MRSVHLQVDDRARTPTPGARQGSGRPQNFEDRSPRSHDTSGFRSALRKLRGRPPSPQPRPTHDPDEAAADRTIMTIERRPMTLSRHGRSSSSVSSTSSFSSDTTISAQSQSLATPPIGQSFDYELRINDRRSPAKPSPTPAPSRHSLRSFDFISDTFLPEKTLTSEEDGSTASSTALLEYLDDDDDEEERWWIEERRILRQGLLRQSGQRLKTSKSSSAIVSR